VMRDKRDWRGLEGFGGLQSIDRPSLWLEGVDDIESDGSAIRLFPRPVITVSRKRFKISLLFRNLEMSRCARRSTMRELRRSPLDITLSHISGDETFETT
jgi:hypothetical protein